VKGNHHHVAVVIGNGQNPVLVALSLAFNNSEMMQELVIA